MNNLADRMLPLRELSRFIGIAPAANHLIGDLLTVGRNVCLAHLPLLSVRSISLLNFFCTGDIAGTVKNLSQID